MESCNTIQDYNVNQINSRISSTTGYNISKTFANYSYNPNGICTSVASANLLQYYDDYINDSFVEDEYEYNEIGILTILIKKISNIDNFIDNGGATLNETVNGLNSYISDIGVNYEAVSYSYDSGQICSLIKHDIPVIMFLQDISVAEGGYGNHAVVCNGYVNELGKVCCYYLVDGWGNSCAAFTRLTNISYIITFEEK